MSNTGDDLFSGATTTTGGVKWVSADHSLVETKTLEQLRRAAIDTIRRCDLALYGRDDKTIPRRKR